MNRQTNQVLWAVATLVLAANSAQAQLASNKETLRGHQNVFVSVSTPDSEVAVNDLKLKKESLENFVVKRLRRNNIDVSTTFTNQTLILEIKVDLVKVASVDDQDFFAFVSQFEAIQAARLATNKQGALATTWRETQFGGITRENARLLRESVILNLEKFIADWNIVHGL